MLLVKMCPLILDGDNMTSMGEIKIRIRSIKETRQITKAMNLVSAAKLRKARQQREHTLPYFNKVKSTMADILTHSANVNSAFFDIRHKKKSIKKAYFIITGDKGLAGGYNHNIIKFTEEKLKETPNALLMVAGLLGKSHFIRGNYNVLQEFDYIVQNPTVYRAREISELLLDLYSKGEVDEVDMIYTEMESTVRLKPNVMKVLPLDLEEFDAKDTRPKVTNPDENLIYEPSPQAVLDMLIPKYVKGVVYGALVESFTSEQSARMTAMDSATKNADEMLQKLGLFYNRARQAAITQEITEIVGGAEALR